MKNILSSLFIGPIISSIMLLSLISVASASDYYVATWGNNSNLGTYDAPWQNISYATQRAYAGDTIYLFNGTWYREKVMFKNSGNSTHPIILTAFNGTPILDGVDGMDMGILAGYYDGSYHHREYITINGLTVKNYQYHIYVRKSSYISVSNCTILPNATLTAQTSPGNSPKGIYLQEDVHYSTVINNIVIGDAWNSIAVVGRYYSGGSWHSIESTHNEITKNIVIGNNLHGSIDVSGNVSDITISDNTVLNATQTAIFFHQGIYKNIYLFNNTIINSLLGVGGTVHNSNTDKMYNAIFSNNLIINSSTYAIQLRNVHNISLNNNVVENTTYEGVYFAGTNINLTENEIKEVKSAYANYRISNLNPEGGSGIIKNAVDRSYKVISTSGASVAVGYSDGKVFSETGKNTAKWYPNKSCDYLVQDEIVTINTYPMTARPATDPATITVNKFDTSLSPGNILISFTAKTINGNNVVFTVNELPPGHNYLIKRDGADFTTLQANSSGSIQFSYSAWPEHTFTIEELSTGSPSASAGPDSTTNTGAGIFLDGSASSDDNGIVSYIWDFDASDGLQQDATGAVVSHTYNTPGIYTVTLTVTDTDGNTDSDIVTITVNGPEVEVTLTLYQGWNLISLPVINNSYTASSMASAIGDVDYVLKRNPITYEYLLFDPESYTPGDDFSILPDEAYYIYLNSSTKSFLIRGTPPGPRTIQLTKGMNLIGWTSLNSSNALATFIEPLSENIVYTAKRKSPYSGYESYVAVPEFSEPKDNFIVEPGYGYFVYVTSDCTLYHT